MVEDLLVLDDGGFAVAGHVIEVESRAWVARMSAQFSIEWEYVGEPAPSQMYAIDLADDGTFVVAGEQTLADGSTDAWVLRLAP